ncbi:MAG: TetR/AcrR family transcriptional regulator, partial [Pseudomonadota bacterium]
MPRIELRPRKSPRQVRSADTVETILAAAARVLERESLAGFNTNRVAAVAGVSVGSLYQYFPNKSALIAALIDRQQTALADA